MISAKKTVHPYISHFYVAIINPVSRYIISFCNWCLLNSHNCTDGTTPAIHLALVLSQKREFYWEKMDYWGITNCSLKDFASISITNNEKIANMYHNVYIVCPYIPLAGIFQPIILDHWEVNHTNPKIVQLFIMYSTYVRM